MNNLEIVSQNPVIHVSQGLKSYDFVASMAVDFKEAGSNTLYSAVLNTGNGGSLKRATINLKRRTLSRQTFMIIVISFKIFRTSLYHRSPSTGSWLM